jgi:hypothetical protein
MIMNDRSCQKIITQIHNKTGCPYWSIIGCLKLCDYDSEKTMEMLKGIYCVIGDNPDVVIKRREKELEEKLKENKNE